MFGKVKTRRVAHQQCRRRFQLYAFFKNIGVDSLNDLLEGAKFNKKIGLGKEELIMTTMASRQSVTRTTDCTIGQPNLG